MLALPILREAGPRIRAGERFLHRDVRWVHTGEISDIARFLTGGEVLLTAATGIGDSERAQRRYIRELAEVGTAAVIIELGRSLKSVSRAMVDEATKGELVLVTLDAEVPFVAVTHAVHTQLISAAHAALVRATEIDDALNRLILDGAPLPAMLELLSEHLRNPVILEDPTHRVVAYGRASGTFAPLLRTWRAHARDAHERTPDASVFNAASDPPCAWTEIGVRGERWGRLHVLEVDSPLDDVARLALGRAGASIALHLMAERQDYLSDEAEHALVRGVAAMRDFNGQEFLDRAAGLGVALDGELVVLATSCPQPARGEQLEASVGELVTATRAAFAAVDWPAVVGLAEGIVVCVAGADAGDGYEAKARALADALARDVTTPTCIGVSRSCRASSLPRAFQEARTAHRLSPLDVTVQVQMYDELALHRLLAPLVAGPELATFVEGELGDLVAYDERHSSDLLRTLDAFLQANGNKQLMGQLLHLRRRSVYYRLERIEQVLGCSLDRPDRRARLYVALRGRELLNDQPAYPLPA